MVCHLLIIYFAASSDLCFVLDIIVDVATLYQAFKFFSPHSFFHKVRKL